jgi:tetratricopeptide (TPR) repeat protein
MGCRFNWRWLVVVVGGWVGAGCVWAGVSDGPVGPEPPSAAAAEAASEASALSAERAEREGRAAVDRDLRRLMELDDEALEEIDRWIEEEQAARHEGVSLGEVTLRARILERVRPVREGYEGFLKRHSDHAAGHLAYASFLMEIGEEGLAVEHMETSRRLDPKNPAAWNNLANHYGHRGPVVKAFEYYAQAIDLNPREPTYYQNLATTVYLFRKDAREFYDIDEEAVFEKALGLYREAMKLDPGNFLLAADYAQSYYGMQSLGLVRPDEREAISRRIAERAIEAWNGVLKLATDELQRQSTLIHLARNKITAGRLTEARADLVAVTLEEVLPLKQRVQRNLERLSTAGDR